MLDTIDTRLNLFSPVKVGPYELPDRIVMSPMTRSRAGEGNAPTAAVSPQQYLLNGTPVSATRHLRSIFEGTLITAQGYTFETGNKVLAAGVADLVGFGVLFLANPDLPARFALGAPLNEPDPKTFYGGDERGYTDYPALELQTA